MNPSNASPTQANPTESESGRASGGLAGAAQRIKSTARETADQVKNAASSTVARAKEEAGKIADGRRQVAADRIGGYSSAVHESAKSLEEKDPNIAWFTHRAADRLQNVANYVRDRDFAALRRDAEDVARRHPAAFFGGLFVAGLLVGNLLKASGSAAAGSASRSSNGSLGQASSEEMSGEGGCFCETSEGPAADLSNDNSMST
jgi:hypothetical protein